MGLNGTVGCYRLAGLEKLVAFGAMEIWIVGGADPPCHPLCCPAYLYQRSLGCGHSDEAPWACSAQRVDDERQGVDAHIRRPSISAQEIAFHNKSLSSNIVGVYFRKKENLMTNQAAKSELMQNLLCKLTTTTRHNQKIRIHHGFVSLTPNKGE